MLNGEQPSDPEDSENAVTEPPKRFNEWIDENRERAKGWGTMPYFVRDNSQYVENFRVDTYSASERTFTRHRHTSPAMKVSMENYLQKLYPQLENTEKAAIYDYTRGDVSDFRHLNNHLRKGNLSEFEQAFSELLSQGLAKLPTTEETVYRTIRLNKTNLTKWIDMAEKQEIQKWESFTSASSELSSVEKFMKRKSENRKNNETDILIAIKSKYGHPIEELSMFNGRNGLPNQHEVLFHKGCCVQFNRLVQDGSGQYIFYVTEI